MAETATPPKETSGPETRNFQAEVAKLLDIVVHSLYSHREIFLRELISNASDACDKLRYAALTDPKLREGGEDFAIRLSVDPAAKTLTIADNGIGMNHDELVANLGTIAKSGTAEFLKAASAKDGKKDVNLIGQFGVGFYSAFMVADKVDVISRKAGEEKGWVWSSAGQGSFTVAESPGAARGARIVLHIKDDAKEFLEAQRLRHIVKTYSDHIAIPVILDPIPREKKEGEEAPQPETLNSASALWMRPKNEITAEQYKEFYHHVGHTFDEPWHTLHFRAEGAIEYTALLFIPTQKPFDLFHPERKSHVKLYVNRVFISDQIDTLMPRYLRFVRGVVDSSDLPLNISREMLQDNPVLRKIQAGITKRLLKDLKDRAENAAEYKKFWDAFGAVFKEGLYEDFERKEDLLDLARFKSTASDELMSLKDYVGRMKQGQEAIYFITGENAAALKGSPQLEGFLAKGIEVLLLTDPIDEFWVGTVGTYDKKQFKSVAEAGPDLSAIAGGEDKAKTEAAAESVKGVIEKLKQSLGENVADVRASTRLTGSPVCLVADTGGMSLHLARMLKQHGDGASMPIHRVLEINPSHPLITGIEKLTGADFDDAAFLLLDQARIVEGETVPDPAAFARRLSAVMTKGLV
ncbi:MAG: molecular chaperone HtpG [Rhodospirillaceae bacterium]|nr:molecular chaperone HtpG [Rhodospirillaceae bacterium]